MLARFRVLVALADTLMIADVALAQLAVSVELLLALLVKLICLNRVWIG